MCTFKLGCWQRLKSEARAKPSNSIRALILTRPFSHFLYCFALMMWTTSGNVSTSETTAKTKERPTGWFQTGTANQESVDVWLGRKIFAILIADTAAVQNSGVLGGLGRNRVSKPFS